MTPPPLRTVDEVCARLQISRATLDLLVKSRQLAAVDVSSHVARPDRRVQGLRARPELRFLDEDLDAFLRSRRTPVAAGDSLGARAAHARPVLVRRRAAAALTTPGAARYVG
jgi:hypothetical protein